MAIPIPSMILKQLHTFGSLRNTCRRREFSVKNRLNDTTPDRADRAEIRRLRVAARRDLRAAGGRLAADAGPVGRRAARFSPRRTLDIVAAVTRWTWASTRSRFASRRGRLASSSSRSMTPSLPKKSRRWPTSPRQR